MGKEHSKTRLNLTNPYIFWSLIVTFLVLIFVFHSYFNSSTGTEESTQVNPNIVERSYQDNSHRGSIVVDVNNLDHMDFEKHQPQLQEDISFISSFKEKNITFFLLLIYTVAISILFLYREKQNKVKLLHMEKIEDTIKIKLAEKEQKTYLYEHLKDDLTIHKNMIEPELKLEKIEEELTADPRYIIINARVILEKTILKLYTYYFQEEATLNEMIQALYKKRVLSPALNNYAHTIKAFGNKAVHPSLDSTSYYKPKDALLVLNTLLQYLQDLKSANLPEK